MMARRVIVFDTSLLCCLLAVPGKETAGSDDDRWDQNRVKDLIDKEDGSLFVLPLTTIIETGNHIAQSSSRRFEVAKSLATYIHSSAKATSPWAAFTDQSELWAPEKLIELGDSWPKLAESRLTLGDATIKDVAEFYARGGYHVEIATADAGLKAYEPLAPVRTPRRRL